MGDVVIVTIINISTTATKVTGIIISASFSIVIIIITFTIIIITIIFISLLLVKNLVNNC